MNVTVQGESHRLLTGSPYVAYSYAYPHKTAYRSLPRPLPLREVWQTEAQDALFLYLHVPFCEYRCGFCNLFTLSQPKAPLTQRYLDAVRSEATTIANTLDKARYVRLALGGGTPTFLSSTELEQLFLIVRDVGGAKPGKIPVSCEASPATLDAEKLAILREYGVDRLSLGIQSFDERDAQAMGRPLRATDVKRTRELLSEQRFPVLNLDLIYGGSTQTKATWLESVDEAIDWTAEEIYLYPLYVRPLTGLAKGKPWDDHRLALYRAGRDRLLEKGYTQVSMRMFQRRSTLETGPTYCCQDDGMVGLGCGARSYTRSLHYSREYAVRSSNVAGIVSDYLERSKADFTHVKHGFVLDIDEQQRRMLIISLLQATGLQRTHYKRRFQSDVLEDFRQLLGLADCGMAEINSERIQLTPAGLERSDAIGPWLYSESVRQLSEGFQWR
ncbi:MAG: STM4012 family radical SAM protein [Pirellulales bacterium]|nr:STM4012 family radical SAM protein [Pirellulales bacterium]